MLSGQLWLIYALVFGAALFAVQGFYVLLFRTRGERRAVNRRLLLSRKLDNQAQVLEALRRERGVEAFTRAPLLGRLNRLLTQSGLRLSGMNIALMAIGGGLVFYLLTRLLSGSDLLALALALPASVALIYLFVLRARGKRIAAFGQQFPDALDVIVRGLRAGHPFRVALALVSREMPDPVGTEFGIVADEIMFGLDQSVAVDNLCDRVGLPDLHFFATAVTVQHQTGGNLAEILSRLSRLLRNRLKLRLKIRALSAEGRLSAVALSLTPFVLFAIISLLHPDYFSAIRSHPVVPIAITVGALMLLIGNIVMYRMVNFKF